ncbi:MAG: glycogen synthase [bacterium]
MNILFASSEVFPFAKTGGLADVSYSLPKALKKLGNNINVITPLYKTTTDKGFNLIKISEIKVPHLDNLVNVEIYRASDFNDFGALFVNYPSYFNRDQLYGSEKNEFADNHFRFMLFSRAILEYILTLDSPPEILHLNDWHTGLVKPYLDVHYKDKFNKIKTIFTIHNLGYQGRYQNDVLKDLDLPDEYSNEDMLGENKEIAIIKGGFLCDAVNTVSPTYAKEITTQEFGFGLDDDLRRIEYKLSGILNGIDYELWNPNTDSDIPANYCKDNFENKHKICKPRLQKELGLDVRGDLMLCGIITRLTSQKGIDILTDMLEKGLPKDTQLSILGTGEEIYHRRLTDISTSYKGKISVVLGFDTALARRIYAGCDVFLLPSRYEPCGLSQMIAMAYGTIPIARRTGGLADSIIDTSDKSDITSRYSTGFLFDDYSSLSFRKTIEKVREILSDKDLWHSLILNCFNQNFSWDESTKKYIELYKKVQKE